MRPLSLAILALLLVVGLFCATGAAWSVEVRSLVFRQDFLNLTPEQLASAPYRFTFPKAGDAATALPRGTWELDAATVTFFVELSTEGFLVNISGATVPFARVTLGALVIDAGNSLGAVFPWTIAEQEVSHQQQFRAWRSLQQVIFGPGGGSWHPGDYSSPEAILLLFAGTGAWYDEVTALATSQSIGISNFTQNVTTLVSGSMTLTYRFVGQSIALPPTWPMLAGGLLLIGLRRRRRSGRAALVRGETKRAASRALRS